MSIQQNNNFRKLKSKLRKIKFPIQLDFEKVAQGEPKEFLPIINHILLEFNQDMATIIIDNGYDLYGKKDWKFMESVFKL